MTRVPASDPQPDPGAHGIIPDREPVARTWTDNLGNAPIERRVDGLTELVRRGARRIGLQEAGGRDGRRVVRLFLKRHPSWRVYRPVHTRGAKAVPILYDSHHVKVARLASFMAVLSRFVGRGPGPDRAKAKPILLLVYRVRLAGKTRLRRPVWSPTTGRHLNTHFISGVQTDGDNDSLRDEHHHDHARALAELIGTGDQMRRTIVTMDGNADPDYPGWAPVKATGIAGWAEHTEPTHGERRRYDYVLGPDGDRLYVRGYSDHAFVGAGV